MIKNSPNFKQNGSVHIVIISILVLAVLGALCFVLWNNYFNNKKVASNKNVQTSTFLKMSSSSSTASTAIDPTSSWKTTTSPLTGYSIKYPTDWILTQGNGTGEQILTNSYGGKSFNTTLVSARTDGTPDKLPTIRYMCVIVNDYTGSWSSAPQSNDGSSTPLVSFQPNTSTTLNIAVARNDLNPNVSMLSQMYVATAQGSTQIPLSSGGWLEVSSSFDCIQGDNEALKNSSDTFSQQPETKTAETIIQSLRFQ